MEVVLVILALVCAVFGVAGSILPVIPGPPLSFVGLLLIHWSRYADYSLRFLVIWGAVVIAVSVADYLLTPWLTRKSGGSRAASRGALVGLILGIFVFPPVGIILGPFVGAFLGEWIHDSSQLGKALHVALGTFVAFVVGTGLKLAVCGVLCYYTVRPLFG